MRKREEEILKILTYLSGKTKFFTKPKLILIGGYALRAFIKFSRYTRDCDFILKKKNGWYLDELKQIIPKGWRVEALEKKDGYGFMRWIKFLKYDKARIKVSLDFMEGEIRGREKEEVVIIDDEMINNSEEVTITIAGHEVRVHVPRYVDYVIMKVISCRASDIRDLASLIHENGIPKELRRRVEKIIPNPAIFYAKIKERIIPEIKSKTFLDSWRGSMATTEYKEGDKEEVISEFESILKII